MAKNPKSEQTNGAASNDGAASAPPPPAEVTAGTKKIKAGKAPAKKAASKKAGAKSGVKKSATRRAPVKAKSYEPSDADIRLRAYFIAERRVQLALQGDPANDWIEARQQLLEEAGQNPQARQD